MEQIANWGNYPVMEAEMRTADNDAGLRTFLLASEKPLIARGMGRCYGDSALAPRIFSTLRMNRMLAFDPATGTLACEAGVTFEDILNTFVPRGYFLPVTPGTKFITVGGAIASDVHGKNHHAKGTFSDHVSWFDIMVATGQVVRCSRTENTELFHLSCGGQGLTGVILRASFQLVPVETSYIHQLALKARNLEHVLELFDEYASWTNSVAWIDCLSKGNKLGRSILTVGEFAKKEQLVSSAQKANPLALHKPGKLFVPFNFPGFVLNPLTVKAFNFLYYGKQFKSVQESIIHYDTFYYPLDVIHHWNRIYGKRGFTQYQFVIPKEAGKEGLRKIISEIGKANMGSFLTVLKLFGEQDENYVRFPQAGYTLAMDFPISEKIFAFLKRMDDWILDYGGRVYLTKDVRMDADFMKKTYPEAASFSQKIHQLDPQQKIMSVQGMRVFPTK